jgi:hypothetical protein
MAADEARKLDEARTLAEARTPNESMAPREGRSWPNRISLAEARSTHWRKSGGASGAGAWNANCAKFAMDMVIAARLGGGGDVMIGYGTLKATIKVQHEKAARPTTLCTEMVRVRLNTLRAKQEPQATAVKAATENRRMRHGRKPSASSALLQTSVRRSSWPRAARP